MDCHRTILICRDARGFAEIHHIHPDGHLESHAEAKARLMHRNYRNSPDLFRSKYDLLNEAYQRRGEQINYVKEPRTNSFLREEPFQDEP